MFIFSERKKKELLFANHGDLQKAIEQWCLPLSNQTLPPTPSLNRTQRLPPLEQNSNNTPTIFLPHTVPSVSNNERPLSISSLVPHQQNNETSQPTRSSSSDAITRGVGTKNSEVASMTMNEKHSLMKQILLSYGARYRVACLNALLAEVGFI